MAVPDFGSLIQNVHGLHDLEFTKEKGSHVEVDVEKIPSSKKHSQVESLCYSTFLGCQGRLEMLAKINPQQR